MTPARLVILTFLVISRTGITDPGKFVLHELIINQPNIFPANKLGPFAYCCPKI